MSRVLKLQQALARHFRIAELKGRSVISCNTYKEAKRLRSLFHTFRRYLDRVEKKDPSQQKLDDASGMLELLAIKDNLYFSIVRKRGDRGELIVEYKDTLWLRKTLEQAAGVNERAMVYDSDTLRKKMCADDSFWLDDED